MWLRLAVTSKELLSYLVIVLMNAVWDTGCRSTWISGIWPAVFNLHNMENKNMTSLSFPYFLLISFKFLFPRLLSVISEKKTNVIPLNWRSLKYLRALNKTYLETIQWRQFLLNLWFSFVIKHSFYWNQLAHILITVNMRFSKERLAFNFTARRSNTSG